MTPGTYAVCVGEAEDLDRVLHGKDERELDWEDDDEDDEEDDCEYVAEDEGMYDEEEEDEPDGPANRGVVEEEVYAEVEDSDEEDVDALVIVPADVDAASCRFT